MLFGVRVFQESRSNALKQSINKKSSYAVFLNAHMLYEHNKNDRFKNVLDDASFVFPDGMPIIYSLRFIKKKKQERIAGNDLIFDLVQKAQEQSLKMYWIGGDENVLDTISKSLDSIGILHEVYSPPYVPIDEFDFEHQANQIQAFDPDIILVGLGCPKQEIWMHRMKNRLDAPMYGLGGAFLLYAGMDSRAPKLMRTLSLEWLYRLILEPKRLFKRYLITNTYFCWLFIKEIFKQRG